MSRELWELIYTFGLMLVFGAMGFYAGFLIGAEEEAEDQLAFHAEVREQLDEYRAFADRVESWMWVLGCNGDPVAVIESIDEKRQLVTLACSPEVVVP